MFSELWARVRSLFAPHRREEVDDEIRFHIERQVEANLALGLSPLEARRQAAIAFGGQQSAREQCHEARPSWRLELIGRDLRFAVRGLFRNPGLATVAVLTLALAIGANTTIFSLLNQALLRALPVRDPQQLVVMDFAGEADGHTHSEGGDTVGHRHEFSYPMYRDLRDRNGVLDGLVASGPAAAGVTWNNRAEAATAEIVSGNYFDVLGVQPAAGRLFASSDETTEGANQVVVLNFNYWKSRFALAPVVGNTILLNGTPFTVIGVAAPGFHSVVWGRTPAIYVPVTMQRTLLPEWPGVTDRGNYWLTIAGRLRPGITAVQASASLNQLFHAVRAQEFTALHDQSPKARQGFVDASHLNVVAGARGFSPMRDDLRMPLLIIMGMAFLVIAMAVVNVASLLLVRAANRVREFSVRYAMGATAPQILRQLLCEGILLGVVGAGLGLAIAPEALRLLIRWIQGAANDDIGALTPTLDWRVFTFAVVVMLAGSIVFSLAPAVQFWNPRLADALKQHMSSGLGGSLHFRRTCVALQIGFSLLLVVGAGMFVRTIQNLRNVDPGFATDRLLTFHVAPELAGYSPSGVVPVELRLLDSIRVLPGIRSVGATNDRDLADDEITGDVYVTGIPTKPNDSEFDVELPWVSTGYLQAMGIPLVAGRFFNSSDTATSQKVAIVNQSFAKHYFAGPQAALGRHIGRPRRPATDAIIVGVVRDVKHATVRDPAAPECYTLFQQAEKPTGLTFDIRTWQQPNAAVGGIRAAVANIDTKLIVNDFITMRDQIDDSIASERAIALLASVFAGMAALLAGIGLYGILAYSTAQRTREIGIRMALGARRGGVVSLILRETLILTGIAAGVTIPVALLGTNAIRSQLFGVSTADPAVYAAGILAVCLVAALAGFVPACRAASVDPASALRTE